MTQPKTGSSLVVTNPPTHLIQPTTDDRHPMSQKHKYFINLPPERRLAKEDLFTLSKPGDFDRYWFDRGLCLRRNPHHQWESTSTIYFAGVCYSSPALRFFYEHDVWHDREEARGPFWTLARHNRLENPQRTHTPILAPDLRFRADLALALPDKIVKDAEGRQIRVLDTPSAIIRLPDDWPRWAKDEPLRSLQESVRALRTLRSRSPQGYTYFQVKHGLGAADSPWWWRLANPKNGGLDWSTDESGLPAIAYVLESKAKARESAQ